MKTRILSLLLTLALLFGLMSVCAFAAENLEGDTNGNGTVDVTLTISEGTDGFYETKQGYYLVKEALSVPYFDLALYGLGQYYYNPNCYSSSEQLPGTKETAQGVVTTMHVMIYATERFVLGYDDKSCGTGDSVEDGLFDHISWSQGAGSSFMSFWNESTNLNYYLDYQYPLGREGWGSTSDQQALSDGVAIDIHFIVGNATGSQYSFLEREDGVRDHAVLTKGETCQLTLKKTTSSYGSVTQTAPVVNTTVYYMDASSYTGQKVNAWTSLGQTDSDGKITVPATLDAGTYYLSCMGADEAAGERGPAAFILTVKEPGQTSTASIAAVASSDSVAIGNTVEVGFVLTGNPGIEEAAFALTYNSDALTFTGLKENGGLLSGATASGDQVSWSGEKVTSDGRLFTALFEAKAEGEAQIGLTTTLADTVSSAKVQIVPAVSATEVSLNYGEKAIEVGETVNLSAVVEPSNSTDAVIWSSSAPEVASVNQRGMVTGLSAGSASITATAGSASAFCTVTVEAEQSIVGRSEKGYGDPDSYATMTGIKFIQFNGKNEAVKNIYKLELTGHEEFSLMVPEEPLPQSKAYKLDGTQCFGGTWGEKLGQNRINGYGLKTKDLLVDYADLLAAVGEENAEKLGVKEGNLLAFLFVNEGTYKYGILFEITPVSATEISISDTLRLTEGETKTLSVSVKPAESTDIASVVWSSNASEIATVDENGTVTAVAPGTTTIMATMGELTDTCEVTVTKAPVSIPVPSNGGWGGSVTGMTIGGIDIVSYKWDGLDLYVYTNVESGIADIVYAVNSYGQDSKVSETVTIENYEGSCVKDIRIGWDTYTWRVYFKKNVPTTSLELDQDKAEILIGDKMTIQAILSEGSTSMVTWTSSEETVAKVDQNGNVTGVAEGTSIITAETEGLKAICTVTVKAVHADTITISGNGVENGKLRLRFNESVQLTATTNPERITDQITWSAEPSGIVYLNNGWLQANAAGNVTITVTAGYVSASVEVEIYTVSAESITLSQNEATLNYKDTLTLTANVMPEDHTDGSVIWSSSNGNVVTVDHGTVQAVGAGEATVTAAIGEVSASCKITVPEYYSVSDEFPAFPHDYWDTTSLNKLIVTGAEVDELQWQLDEENSNKVLVDVTLSEFTQDGVSVKAIAEFNGPWGYNKSVSGEAEIMDGIASIELVASDWYMNTVTLDFQFKVAPKSNVTIVKELIDAIGEVTLDSKDAIEAAEAAYNVLTDEQKALVSNYDALVAARKAYDDLAAAKAVEDLIDAIGDVTLSSKGDIDAARAAYDALTEEQKALVGNYQTLLDAEASYEAQLPPVVPGKLDFGTAEKTEPAVGFSDVVSGDWFADAVSYVYQNGLMNGTGDGKFSPNANTTRGMIVTILARLEGVDTTTGATWYEAGRQWAMKNGISDGTSMDGQITREQLATMLYRYAQLKGRDTTARAELSTFADASGVSDWAAEAMQWAVAKGLIQGSSNQLTPTAPATRAQVATILMRFIG